MGLDVVGVGWGRTGTMSTKLALERLGFGPCHHMIEVFGSTAEHVRGWRRLACGEPVDLDGLYEGYRAAVDWPTVAFWRQVLDAYPDAKVLLTERDAQAWYDSFAATIRYGIPPEHPGEGDDTAAMLHEVIVPHSLGGEIGTRRQLVERYEQHVADVKATVPPDRLLVWSVTEGWPRLCAFLGVEIPDEPFPRSNDREEFMQLFAGEGGGRG
jgi:hypothetical protein